MARAFGVITAQPLKSATALNEARKCGTWRLSKCKSKKATNELSQVFFVASRRRRENETRSHNTYKNSPMCMHGMTINKAPTQPWYSKATLVPAGSCAEPIS